MQGNLEIAEKCCQQTKAYERLSFLYAVAGDNEKLWKMLKLAEMRGDVMSRYSNTLYLGSASARTKVLEDSGHLSLAHVCAAAHGLQVRARPLHLPRAALAAGRVGRVLRRPRAALDACKCTACT